MLSAKNFSNERWNGPKGLLSNKAHSKLLQLESNKEQQQIQQQQLQQQQQFPLNQNNMNEDIQMTKQLNQKREAISQQYQINPSSQSYSFFPTKGPLVSNNIKLNQKSLPKLSSPSLTLIPQSSKLDSLTANLFQNQNNMSESNTSQMQQSSSMVSGQQSSQERRGISSRSGQQQQQQRKGIKQDDDILLSNNTNNKEMMNQKYNNNHRNSNRVSDKIDQFLAYDYSVQQRNLDNLLSQPQCHKLLYHEQDNQSAQQSYNIEAGGVQDNVDDFNNSGQMKFKKNNTNNNINQNEKPLSERFNDNSCYNNINNNFNLISISNNNDQSKLNNNNNNQNELGKNNSQSNLKNNSKLLESSNSKYDVIKNQQSLPNSAKNMNLTYQNQSNSNKHTSLSQNRFNNNNNNNNINNQNQNQQNGLDMIIYGSQALDYSKQNKNMLESPDQKQQYNMNQYAMSKTDQLIAYSQQKNDERDSFSLQYQQMQQQQIQYQQQQSGKFPYFISQGGIQSAKQIQYRIQQTEDMKNQQQLLDFINGNRKEGKQQQYLHQQRQQTSSSSSVAQRRNHPYPDFQIERKRNLQKPLYLLSDESELTQKYNHNQQQQQQLLVNPLSNETQTTSSQLIKISSPEQNNQNDNSDELNNNQNQQQQQLVQQQIQQQQTQQQQSQTQINFNPNQQYQQQPEGIVELAITGQNSQDQQRRQLLRLNPYKIRYLELQQKKWNMQMNQQQNQNLNINNNPQFFGQNQIINQYGQQQSINLLDFKGLTNNNINNIVQNNNNNNNNLNSIVSMQQSLGINQMNQQSVQQYRYYVGYGNNAELIKRLLKSRDWWIEYNSETQQSGGFNFRWTQGIQGIKYDKLNQNQLKQCVNHFEEHREISQKDLLVKNLKLFCETNKIALFSITPCTFIIDLNDDACELQITKFANFFCKHHPKIEINENNKKMIAEFKKNIKSLYYSVNANYKKLKANIYSKPIMFPSFVNKINNNNNSSNNINNNSSNNISNNNGNYIWLLKTTIYNRGRGIELFSSFEQLEKQMREYADGTFDRNLFLAEEHYSHQTEQAKLSSTSPNKKNDDSQPQSSQSNDQQPSLVQQVSLSTQINSQMQISSSINTIGTNDNVQSSSTQIQQQQNNQQQPTSTKNPNNTKEVQKWQILKSQTFVFQKYIERPMLIKGRKFDMRMFVLLTHNMDSYFYKCGYIRTASEIYRMDDLDNQFIHLTNNAVQKYAKNYGEFEDGNILSLEQFDEFIKNNSSQYEGCNLYGKIIPQIREICLMTLASVKKKLNSQDKKYCFELFGYDFFIDEDFRVWLIEVNSNPSIEESNQYLHQFMPRLLDDTFKLTIDQIFPRPPGSGGLSQQASNPSTKNNASNNNNSPNSINQKQFQFQKRNSSIVMQSNIIQYNQINNNFENQIGQNNNNNNVSNQNNMVDNNNHNTIQKENNSLQQNQLSPPRNLNNVIQDDQSKESKTNNNEEQQKKTMNSKKRQKFPLIGHNDDENLWQFMVNLNRFNYNTYIGQVLNSVQPQTYHPLKDILAQSSKLVNTKSSKKQF